MAVKEHVKQRCNMDCGVACIAMMAGVPYERAYAVVHPGVCSWGLWYGEIMAAIYRLTGRTPRLTVRRQPTSLWLYLKRVRVRAPEIVLCRRKEVPPGVDPHHYFVTDETEAVYDPLRDGPVAREDVARSAQGGWIVVGIVG